MSRKKAFSFDVPSDEPWTFDINDDTVEVVGAVDGIKLLTFMGIMGSDFVGDYTRANAILEWLRHCFAGEMVASQKARADAEARREAADDEDKEGIEIPEPVARWSVFIAAVDHNKLDIEKLGEIAGWLGDELSEHPTQPEPSASGPSETGPSSAVGSSSPVLTGVE